MFDFRIIDTPDGNQVIDRTLKTPLESLTPLQMVEYVEMDVQIAYIERMKREEERREKEEKCKQNFIKNLAYKAACFLCTI